MRTGSGQMAVRLYEGLEPQTGNGAFSYYIYTKQKKETIYSQRRRRRRMSSFDIFFVKRGRSWHPSRRSLALHMEMKRNERESHKLLMIFLFSLLILEE